MASNVVRTIKIIRFNPDTTGCARAETEINALVTKGYKILAVNGHHGKAYVVMGLSEALA